MPKNLTVGSLKAQVVSNEANKKLTKKRNDIQTRQVLPEFQTIYVIQHLKSFSITPEKNQTLLDTALQQGQQLDYKCKKGTCGKCTVRLLKGSKFLAPPNEQEHEKLGTSINEDNRLACQSLIE